MSARLIVLGVILAPVTVVCAVALYVWHVDGTVVDRSRRAGL
jgi:hypothetical protein